MSVLAATGAFSDAGLTALVSGALLVCVPLLFAALGELVSERSGVLNIGLEGMMLMGAYAGFVAAYHGGNEWYGFGAGMLAGAGVSLFMVLFCVRLGLDQIVVGIAITLTCEGATALIFESEFAESRPTLGSVDRFVTGHVVPTGDAVLEDVASVPEPVDGPAGVGGTLRSIS